MIAFTSSGAKPKNYFLSQPHQPFFLFGVVWAIVSMVLFLLAYKGVFSLVIARNEFHFYSLVFIVFTQFFHGFLFTTFPRFCMSPTIPKEVYTRINVIYQVGAVLFFVGALVSVWIVLIAVAGILFAHSMAIYTLRWVYLNGEAALKDDPLWIMRAHLIGLLAHGVWFIAVIMSLLGIADWSLILVPVAINLYIIMLTFTVGKRMIPFFSHVNGPKTLRIVEVTFTLLVLKTLCNMFAVPSIEAVISLVLGIYLLWEFLHWKLPIFHSPAILWILHLALFWLPVALIIGALTQVLEVQYGISFLFAGVHLLTLGFITTVLIGFGTRVTLGHSGQPPHADKLAIGLFWWTQVVVIARFALSIDTTLGGSYGWLLDAAAMAWIVLFVVWGGRYGKILVYGK